MYLFYYMTTDIAVITINYKFVDCRYNGYHKRLVRSLIDLLYFPTPFFLQYGKHEENDVQVYVVGLRIVFDG